MRRGLLLASVGLIALTIAISSASAQLRLSFVGYSATNDPRPIGSFDETVDDTLFIDVAGMREPGPGPEWFLSWTSYFHYQTGYPALPNTNAWTACGQSWPNYYDVIAWLEPGELMIGQQAISIGTDPTNTMREDDWHGHVPWNFTHLRIVLVGESDRSTFDSPYCLKTYLIPIVWREVPVATESSTFGKIKALFRTKGSKP